MKNSTLKMFGRAVQLGKKSHLFYDLFFLDRKVIGFVFGTSLAVHLQRWLAGQWLNLV